MSLPVVVRPEAEADIQKIHAELEQVLAGLGGRFATQLRRVLERIESMPWLHGMVWNDVRAVRIKKFRYIVYYVAFADRTEVLAVMHGARDSSAWQSRGKET